VLPLAAFLSIYLDKSTWHWLLDFPLIEGQVPRFFYQGLSGIGFFLSGIFGLIIVQNTPMPKTLSAGLAMLLDTPLHLGVIYFTGSAIRPAQFILVDFTLEIAGVVAASVLVLLLHKPQGDMKIFLALAASFGLIILLSFPGSCTVYWALRSSWIDRILLLNATASSSFTYFRAFKLKATSDKELVDDEKARVFMSNTAAIAMLGLWVAMVVAYGGLLFAN
jgi:hypothetical protein